mmetsp:Transcript_29926/g.79724  ORF Transcript_29926/g.79724 Transcript_29926/m.79724 type:complete len:84 (-) Transcript_29926:417-668(-)
MDSKMPLTKGRTSKTSLLANPENLFVCKAMRLFGSALNGRDKPVGLEARMKDELVFKHCQRRSEETEPCPSGLPFLALLLSGL